MATELRNAFERLTTDSWRSHVGFSPEIVETQELLFARSADPSGLLSAWLQKYQPCLFGRVAAKQNLIRYCFLFEDDLQKR